MTLCMHMATKDALIVCSDGKSSLYHKKSDGSREHVGFIYDEIKSYFYNDIVISVSGSTIYRKNDKKIYEFVDFFDDLYNEAPNMFDIKKFPSYLVSELYASGKCDFGSSGCEFLVSGLSSTGEFEIYQIYGDSGEILKLSEFNDFGLIGIKSLAKSVLSDLIISKMSTESVLKILKFIAKMYCDYGKLIFDEMSDFKDSENYLYMISVGGKWIFYVLDFKTKKGKYVKFCADGKIRYYSKLVQNEFS